jgi:hypothetical protein
MLTRGVKFDTFIFIKSTNRSITLDIGVYLGGGEIDEFSQCGDDSFLNFKFGFYRVLIGHHIIDKSGLRDFVS